MGEEESGGVVHEDVHILEALTQQVFLRILKEFHC